MITLYITVDPAEYLIPGRDGARARIKIKRTARVRADREGFAAIAIVDRQGHLIEQVATVADTVNRRYVVGYRVRVTPTAPDVRCDAETPSRAEVYGNVIETTDKALTIHVPYPRELENLKCDLHFKILEIAVRWG